MRKFHYPVIFIFCIIGSFSQVSHAQTEQQKLTATILHKDSLFWMAYNNCETDKLGQFFTEDVEFYHDKGGITLGLENLAASMKNNLCSNNDFRLRREVVQGTVKVFPLQKSDVIYGAILSGEHLFYIREKGKPEILDGHASFTHLWLLKDSVWKMTRILSYDHHPAAYVNKRKEIILSSNLLGQFAGTYKAPQTGTMIIQKESTGLVLHIGVKKYIIYPETQNLFFSKERDLTFEFIKDDNRKIKKMLIRENGEIVEEATPVK